MKTISRCTLAALFGLLSALPLHAAEKFTLDNQHSYVLWEIEHLGFSKQVGKWYVDGFVLLDKDHPDQSKVEATVKIAKLVTGLPELDKHLMSKSFFDEKKFPTATFISNKVDVLNDTSAKVSGLLTLHGVSKPVTLMVTLNKTGKNPISNKMSVGFTATTTIKRSDFGMDTLLPSLGDEVTLSIGAEAFEDKA
ncbi:YceI family protein [Legionella sp. km772]|uniref:YceI family protein n=1 Tax=Legionella sp. km772 TaxID=2498111 RepID=UPI00351A9508